MRMISETLMAAGREDILRVHARGLIDNGLLDEDVDLAHIALNHTSNYTGAELEVFLFLST